MVFSTVGSGYSNFIYIKTKSKEAGRSCNYASKSQLAKLFTKS